MSLEIAKQNVEILEGSREKCEIAVWGFPGSTKKLDHLSESVKSTMRLTLEKHALLEEDN